MERFNALSRGLQVMFVGSILLLIDSFLDWQQVEVKFGGQTVAEGGASGWHGVGFVMGLLTIVLIAWLVVRLAAAHVTLPLSDSMTGALLGFLILLFTVIKFFADGEFRHWPAWIGLILAVVIAVGAWWAVQEAGGLDTLKTEATDMQSSMGRSDAAGSPSSPPPSDTTAAPAPPAAPAAPTQPAQPLEPSAPAEGTAAPADEPPPESRPA